MINRKGYGGKFSYCSGIFLLLGISLLAKPIHGAESWRAEWERTLRAAEKEGAFTAYVAAGDWTFMDEFQKAYPKIKLRKRIAARGNMLLNRIMAERRAGKYLADVYMTGKSTHWVLYDAKALDPIHPAFILPEVKDESKWFRVSIVGTTPKVVILLALRGIGVLCCIKIPIKSARMRSPILSRGGIFLNPSGKVRLQPILH